MALLPCPNCGKQISEKAIRCPSCGVSIDEINSNTVLCNECKTRYAKNGEACPNCGCPNPVAIKESHTRHKPIKPWAIALPVGIALLIAIVICYFLFWGNGARYNDALERLGLEDYAVAQTMFEALGDYKDASDKATYCKAMLAAIAEFENGVIELDQKNRKFFELIDSAELLLADDAPALEPELLVKLESAISVAKATVYNIPERPSDKDSILALAEEMAAVDYSDAFPPLNDACNNLITSQNRYALVNHPTEEYIIQCLQKVPGVIDVSAVTEETDPMDNLNKSGWYTAHVYFSHELVDQDEVYGNTLIEKGTDAGGSIEVYISAEDATNRNEYLAAFDGGVLASGSHTVIGTCVIRTSNELTATQQKSLEENIVAILTYIDGDSIESVGEPIPEEPVLEEPIPEEPVEEPVPTQEIPAQPTPNVSKPTFTGSVCKDIDGYTGMPLDNTYDFVDGESVFVAGKLTGVSGECKITFHWLFPNGETHDATFALKNNETFNTGMQDIGCGTGYVSVIYGPTGETLATYQFAVSASTRVQAAQDIVKGFLEDGTYWNRYMVRTILTRDYYYTVDEANQAIESFDWNNMALRDANDEIAYALNNTSFLSPGMLKDGLRVTEFNESEIEFAYLNCNADWYHLCAISIEGLYFDSLYGYENYGLPLITKEEIVMELQEGLFTDEQIEYGLNHCGIPFN